METRKVQLSGGTTYTVSLPKSWAQEHGIDAGSELSVQPEGDGSLRIETTRDQSLPDRTATVDATHLSDDAVRRQIHALHAVGADTVTVRDQTGHSTDRRILVDEAVSGLSGFERLGADETSIRLTSLIDADHLDVRKSALRLRLVALGTHRDAVSAVLDGDETLARQVLTGGDEARKLSATITRQFRRALTDLGAVTKLGYSRQRLFEFQEVSRQFERVTGHAEEIARLTLDTNLSVEPALETRLSALASRSRQLAEDATDVILADAGFEAAHSALDAETQLRDDIRTLESELYGYEDAERARQIGLLLDALTETAEAGARLARTAVEKVARYTLQRPGESGRQNV